MLATMDLLEAYPDLYDRDPLPVQLVTDSADNDVSQTDTTETPMVYILKNYRPHLLEKEYINSYHNDNEHLYTCPEGNTERTRLQNIMDEVKLKK